MNMRETTKNKPHSPKRIVDTLNKIPPIQAKTLLEKHYLGVLIQASGTIRSINALGGGYVTLNFDDRDNVQICANFKTPVSRYISALKEGDKVSLKGYIFNVGKNIVVLDNCMIKSNSKKVKKNSVRIKNLQINLGEGDNVIGKKTVNKSHELTKRTKEWYQKPTGLVFLTIVGGVLVVLVTNMLGLTQWPNKSQEGLVLPTENHETQSSVNSITPKEIENTINGAPPLQRADVAANYKGIRVSWPVQLGSGSESISDKNLYSVYLTDRDSGTIVICDIDLNNYPQLKIMKNDQTFTVDGEIDKVDSLLIKLINCKLSF